MRKELNKPIVSDVFRVKSSDKLSEINEVRDSIVKSANPSELSNFLSNALKENKGKKDEAPSILGAQEAIENPNINIIDNHIQEIINTDTINRFKPDVNEIKKISRQKIQNSELHNLYRENLRIKSIKEEVSFKKFCNQI